MSQQVLLNAGVQTDRPSIITNSLLEVKPPPKLRQVHVEEAVVGACFGVCRDGGGCLQQGNSLAKEFWDAVHVQIHG